MSGCWAPANDPLLSAYHDADELLWEEMEQDLRNQGRLSANSLILMALGGSLCAAGVAAHTGMQMVDTLRSQGNGTPAIIFVTAFNEHAVAAFERHATDYILKPFSAERVHRAIDYAKQHSTEERERRLAEILPHLQTLAKSTPRIAIKSKGRILFIEDIGEYKYNADRMLRQLKRAGVLDKLAGLIVGHFTDMKDTTRPFGQPVNEIIHDVFSSFDYPKCFGFPVGHEPATTV